LAALHYGVRPEEARQILLQEPILQGLREGRPEKLQREESQTGFADVLQRVVRMELEKPLPGTDLARIAATIETLACAKSNAIAGVWRDLRAHLSTVKDWEKFQVSFSRGLNALVDHTPSDARQSVHATQLESRSAR
jgi:hypothetical protein